MDVIMRRLTKDDKHYIDELQKSRGFNGVPDYFYSSTCEWVMYGAFCDDKLVSMVALFPYRRLPHKDYPHGYIAELGSMYTMPEYQYRGIATNLLRKMLSNIKNDLPLLDAIVADSTEDAYDIYEHFGFKNSTEYRQWYPLY